MLGEVIEGSNEFHVRHSSHKERSSNRSNFIRNWSKKGLRLSRLNKRSTQKPHRIEKRILSHADVSWAERQIVKPRSKRDYGIFHGKLVVQFVNTSSYIRHVLNPPPLHPEKSTWPTNQYIIMCVLLNLQMIMRVRLPV